MGDFAKVGGKHLHWLVDSARQLVCVFASVSLVFAAVASGELSGKKVSILGDSYSTYSGYSPAAGAYYPLITDGCDVNAVGQTWWKQVIDRTGATLEKNCSWEGSCITTDRYKASSSTWVRSFLYRAKNQDGNGGLGSPDVIFVLGGLNDEWQKNGVCVNTSGSTITITTSLLKTRTKELLTWLKTNHSSAQIYFCVLNPKRDKATGLTPEYGFREVLLEAVSESAAAGCRVKAIDLVYSAMAKDDYDSLGHPKKTGHTKYANTVIAALQAFAAGDGQGPKTATWTAGNGSYLTTTPWSTKALPDGNTDVVFPANKTLTVSMPEATTAGNSYGAAIMVQPNTTLTMNKTLSTYKWCEIWMHATHGYTFLGDNSKFILDKPVNGSRNIELKLGTFSGGIAIGSNTTIESRGNNPNSSGTASVARFKISGGVYGSAKNVYFHGNNGQVSFYPDADTVLTAANSGFHARAEGPSGGVSLASGATLRFTGAENRYTIEALNGGQIYAPDMTLGGVGTVVATGGGTMTLKGFAETASGMSVRIDGCPVICKGTVEIGVSAPATVELSGSAPQLTGVNGHQLKLGAYTTLKLTPELSWSSTQGRFETLKRDPQHTFASGVKYVIDVSKFANITSSRKFCLASATNTAGTASLSYNLPSAANVTLTGTGKDDLSATFTKDSRHFYITLAPKPKTQASFGYEKEYSAAGVTYQLVAFTNTTQAFSWTVPSGVTAVDILAVGGGGAGGAAKYANSCYYGAGGGGAGGVIYRENLAVAAGQSFNVRVGTGGAASATTLPGDGAPTAVTNATAGIRLLAGGGGHGGGSSGAAGDGASGGGGYGANVTGGRANGLGSGSRGGTGIKKADRPRYLAGGGGGAGFAGPTGDGHNGGDGGDGIFCRITGAGVCYGGGGGFGGADPEYNESDGGMGGGGRGGCRGAGEDGVDGLGGGGGGASSTSSTTPFAGGRGGSGVVYIRYVKNAGAAAKPSALSPNGVRVAVHNAAQKEFLAMSETELRTKFSDSTWRGSISKSADCLPFPVTFSWTGGGENTVKVFNADGSLFLEKTVRGTSVALDGFDLGTNYTWQVVNSAKGASAVATFSTEDEVPRMFRDPNFDNVDFDGSTLGSRKLTGVINIRELGGMTGLDGKRVRSGLLFRTAKLNDDSHNSDDPGNGFGESFVKTAAATNFWLNTLGVRTEVDLRDPDEYGRNFASSSVGALGPTVRWVKFTTDSAEQAIPCYNAIFTQHGRTNYKLLLDEMLNPANYPIVFHCSAGKDRTGTLAYILEALLGVDDHAKWMDWVTLVLSSTDQSFSPTASFDPFVAGFQSYSGATINEKVVSFVKAIGISDTLINTFRNAMLEGGYDAGGHVHVYGSWVTNAAPDCVTAGSRYCECTAAGCDNPPVRIVENLPALGHLWGAWTTNRVATTESAGERERTCSRCHETETEEIPQLAPVVTGHPYTATWTGAAGNGAWGTVGNWDREMTNVDAAYIPMSANISIPVNGTIGTAFTVGAGASVKVTTGSGITANFDGANDEVVFIEAGATFEATGPGGFRVTEYEHTADIRLGDNSTVKATGGNYIKLGPVIYDDSENVRFIADGSGSQIKLELSKHHVSSADSTDSYIALNGGIINFDDQPRLAGAPTIQLEDGSSLNNLYRLECNAPGASVTIGTDSTLDIHEPDGLLALGQCEATLELHGTNPQLLLSGYDTKLRFGPGLTVKLMPENDWSATKGRIRAAHQHSNVIMDEGVKFEIDVGRLGTISAAKTFCLVSSASGSLYASTLPLPSASDVKILENGEETLDYDCTFTVDNATSPRALSFTIAPAANPHVHVWDAGTVTVEPTCTEDGVRTRTCTAEGCTTPPKTKTETVPALGHDLGEWSTVVEPQIGIAGEKRRYCSRCEYFESEELAPLPDPTPSDDWGYRIEGLGAAGNEVALVYTNTAAAQSWTVPDGVTSVRLLVVGGGGAGGAGTKPGYGNGGGGGGGAGGYRYESAYSVTPGQSYSVLVGVGGVASNGGNSGFGDITVYGGGCGGSLSAGADGGSGGGGSVGYCVSTVLHNYAGGAAVDANCGNAGGQGLPDDEDAKNNFVAYGSGGGGGGAGAVGADAPNNDAGGNGGEGLACDITGESIVYGSGGGGGSTTLNATIHPGVGGTGAGDGAAASAGADATGYGCGGGGGSGADNAGGRGFQGVVIIRYVDTSVTPEPEIEEFDWLKTDGEGYIVTDYIPNTAKTRIEFRLRFLETTNNCGLAIANRGTAGKTTGADAEWGGAYYASSKSHETDAFFEYYTEPGEAGGSFGTGFEDTGSVHTVVFGAGITALDGATNVIATAAEEKTAAGPLVLFAANYGKTTFTAKAKVKCYGIRIWEVDGGGETLVRDYRAATNELGAATLYDRVNESFLESSGGAGFTVGNGGEDIPAPVIDVGGHGEAAIEIADGYFRVRVTNAARGYRYGYRKATSLADEWSDVLPIETLDGDASERVLSIPVEASDPACFYKIVVW